MTQRTIASPDRPLIVQPPDGSGTPLMGNEGDRIQVNADLVHDLSNMLTIVLGSLDLLQRQRLNRTAQRQLDRAQWSAGRAGELARHMLTTAQEASDHEEATPVQV